MKWQFVEHKRSVHEVSSTFLTLGVDLCPGAKLCRMIICYRSGIEMLRALAHFCVGDIGDNRMSEVLRWYRYYDTKNQDLNKLNLATSSWLAFLSRGSHRVQVANSPFAMNDYEMMTYISITYSSYSSATTDMFTDPLLKRICK